MKQWVEVREKIQAGAKHRRAFQGILWSLTSPWSLTGSHCGGVTARLGHDPIHAVEWGQADDIDEKPNELVFGGVESLCPTLTRQLLLSGRNCCSIGFRSADM